MITTWLIFYVRHSFSDFVWLNTYDQERPTILTTTELKTLHKKLKSLKDVTCVNENNKILEVL